MVKERSQREREREREKITKVETLRNLRKDGLCFRFDRSTIEL
jgi:hypothetical protein